MAIWAGVFSQDVAEQAANAAAGDGSEDYEVDDIGEENGDSEASAQTGFYGGTTGYAGYGNSH